jgi:elongation factor P hydroxylase
MIPRAKLIHKTHTTYLPTPFPVHYYGMPDGRIYLVFSRFYEVDYGETGLEFIFAVHKEFSFDYEKEELNAVSNEFYRTPIYSEMIDKPEPKIKTIKIYRNLNSYGEAQALLNKKAIKMRKQKPMDVNLAS